MIDKHTIVVHALLMCAVAQDKGPDVACERLRTLAERHIQEGNKEVADLLINHFRLLADVSNRIYVIANDVAAIVNKEAR